MKNFIINAFANNKKSALLYTISFGLLAVSVLLVLCTILPLNYETISFVLVVFTAFAFLSFNNEQARMFKCFSFIILAVTCFYSFIIYAVAGLFFPLIAYLIFTVFSILAAIYCSGKIKVGNFNVILSIIGLVGSLMFTIGCFSLVASMLFLVPPYTLFFVGLIFDRTNELKPE